MITNLSNSAASNLSAEISNRISDVDAEESRAMSAELVLTNNLSSEISNRIADVDAEESRALSAELVLTNNLSSEISNRISDVDAEESRAISAEASLASGLSSEISRAQSVEATLDSRIVDIISNVDVTSIDSFSEVVAEMSAEVSRAQSAEASLAADFTNIYTKKNGVNETPDGTTTAFTFVNAVRANSESVYLNGLLLTQGDDYTLNTNGSGYVTGVTFITAPSVGDKVKAYGVY
jgi:DNA-directed RNA polymerase subunit F